MKYFTQTRQAAAARQQCKAFYNKAAGISLAPAHVTKGLLLGP